ncbi:MAG: ABC transporter substrate-binding protein [Candidatus Melainabacteria bacterium]|nr:ABC transporter substrate-binding protein [Candidatus Melainabacteria bacterium]
MSLRLSKFVAASAAPLVLSTLFTILVACSSSADALNDTSGKPTVEKVVNLFSVWHGNEASPAVFKEAASAIDYEEMSEIALGSHWEKLKPVERSEFASTFRKLIEERYYKRWHRIFNKAEISYKSQSPLNGNLYIKTLMTVGRKQDSVIWRLSNRSGSYKIISIAVNQKDLLSRISTKLEQRLRRDSFKQVLSWMRDEADEDDDDDRHSKGQTTSKPQPGL